MTKTAPVEDLFIKGSPQWNQIFNGNHFELTENAARVLEDRYLLKDREGKLTETFDQLITRVCADIAKVEKTPELRSYWAKEFESIMRAGLFIPASPTLMNAGRGNNGSYPACFVMDMLDDLTFHRDSIFGTALQMARIHQYGGGTGCSFAKLRPYMDRVSSTNGAASGPVSFMQVLNWTIAVVMQGGMRRGANMSILPVDHPDIERFISCKGTLDDVYAQIFSTLCDWLALDKKGPIARVIEDALLEYQLQYMNISVGITRDFKKALLHNGTYDLINPRDGSKVAERKAHEIMDLIVEYAWKNGEPGIVDLERINEDDPIGHDGIQSTNPCGEQPLEAWESCNLGSVVMSRMCTQDGIDWDKFNKVVSVATRFLDNVIDATPYPYPHIEEKSKLNRKIGLGVMGLADVLFQLRIPYDSDAGLQVCNDICRQLTETARYVSAGLADEKGEFPNWENSVFPTNGWAKYRNATTTTIAPTGSISIIAGASSAIEPLFRLAFERNVLDQKLVEVSRYFTEAMRANNIPSSILDLVLKEGCCRHIKELPEEIRNVFVTAKEIDSRWHVDMLCAAQGHLCPEDPDGVENAVSKTINFPFEATRRDVYEAFRRAMDKGAKGLTIYRAGSRRIEVLRRSKEGKASSFLHMRPREADELQGNNVRYRIGDCGKIYFNITEDKEGRPFEIFYVSEHKGMECANIGLSQSCRLASVLLRYGVSLEEVARHFLGIKCSKCGRGVGPVGNMVTSCFDAAGKALLKYAEDKKKKDQIAEDQIKRSIFGVCPYCGAELSSAGGRCITCLGCGKFYTCT